MRNPVAALVLVVSLTSAADVRGDARTEIAKRVPEASAMKQADFEKLARGSKAPSEKSLEDKSLTLMLLALDPTDASEAQQAEFRYLTAKRPKPAELAKEIYRMAFRLRGRVVLKGPVTFLSADRIKNVTAEIEGERASGTVTFKVPQLYEGAVRYTAVRSDDEWRITEWRLPAYGIRLVRDDENGRWEKK